MTTHRHNCKTLISKILLALLLAFLSVFVVGCTEQTNAAVLNYVNQVLEEALASQQNISSTNLSENDLTLSADIGVQASGEQASVPASETENEKASDSVEYGQHYTSRDEVAAYLHEFGELPPNFITKKDAEKLGWSSELGNLWEVTDHKSIGGDYFGNYENVLPYKPGRKYYECDIDYRGKSRGAKRIVYSNDGLIYFTSDHYNSFTLLYGEE